MDSLFSEECMQKIPSAGDRETSLNFLFLFLLALLLRTPTGPSPLALGGLGTRLTAACGRTVFTFWTDRDVVDANVGRRRRRRRSHGQPRARSQERAAAHCCSVVVGDGGLINSWGPDSEAFPFGAGVRHSASMTSCCSATAVAAVQPETNRRTLSMRWTSLMPWSRHCDKHTHTY